jgi:hypothetical protein
MNVSIPIINCVQESFGITGQSEVDCHSELREESLLMTERRQILHGVQNGRFFTAFRMADSSLRSEWQILHGVQNGRFFTAFRMTCCYFFRIHECVVFKSIGLTQKAEFQR